VRFTVVQEGETLANEPLRLAYTVHARRAGRRWIIEVPSVPGLVCSSRTLAGVEARTREAMASMLGLEADGFDLVVRH
jgi:hypothetical protein